MNRKADGQMQREWSWLVAIYLFLGGIGGGAYTIAAINGFVGDSGNASTEVGLWIGFPALLIGSLCLLADLGSPQRALLAGMMPRTSWIARGFWIITVFMILAFLHLVLLRFTGVGDAVLKTIAVAGIVFAVMTMAYTGILLSASKGIPFWRSGVVPVVFVVSALVTGHFTIMLGVVLFYPGAETLETMRTMALEAAGLVVLEVLAIVFFLQAAWKLPDPRESAERILRNRAFIIGYFVLGLGAPLVLMPLLTRAIAGGGGGGSVALAAVGAVLGLVGGLILRQAVLICGAYPTLNIAGFEFRRVARPRDPKPDIGLLPPH
jgi:formate-dependent nitrite reductase membrane component NrfD